jgi:hypothetical protein
VCCKVVKIFAGKISFVSLNLSLEELKTLTGLSLSAALRDFVSLI